MNSLNVYMDTCTPDNRVKAMCDCNWDIDPHEVMDENEVLKERIRRLESRP
jgi:hypothetical protein